MVLQRHGRAGVDIESLKDSVVQQSVPRRGNPARSFAMRIRGPRIAYRLPPRGFREVPERSREVSKRSPRGFREVPRGFQEVSERFPRGLREVPKGFQEVSPRGFRELVLSISSVKPHMASYHLNLV